ncbi:hypothetical protein PR202_ga16444 [Eleusine coracana subsp. coracana]|uniref:Photolyase/cryptochrome alpha/beta domain-containing protein n=1 Tax=Eleusine coracana subsp. coracana TaxID=191504 RepID=A0AAV5CLI7_ELECO|nr:hypothetical protein PR202_ga16444 [Eleusine coracana subsp. coracana]
MALLALQLGCLNPAPHRRWSRSRCRIVASNASAAAAVVWFKHDLRIDDHPGLVAAAAEPRRPVVPLYVFDHRILAGYSDKRLELLLFALKDLKVILKSQESDLLVGLGNAEDVILKLVNEVTMQEEEVEYGACSVLANVESSLSNGSFSWGSPPKIVSWSAPLYEYKSLIEVPTSHVQFLKAKLPMPTPLPAPNLPALNVDLNADCLPTLEELKGFLKDSRTQEDNWVPLRSVSAKSILKKIFDQRKIKSTVASNISNGGSIEDTIMVSATSGRRITDSMFASESSLEVRGGTGITLDALAAYLKYLEGTGKASWQELHDKVRLAETRDGASFYTLFGTAIQLGVISRRRVYHEAIQYEKDRNAGFLSPFGYSTPTVTAAVNAICSMEHLICILLQYTVCGHEGPAVLLVHGFGAFLEHFRDNIGNIADSGHRVWAITMVGFGKSEKPNVNYSELFWSELLRDFISDVVRQPVHLVGNSIGGYICAITAGLWPSLAKSLVLLNSAGSIVPNYPFIPLSEKWSSLTKKIQSYDPGAATVIESIFNFNLSIPLNFLFDSFGGRILVVQGMKDPLRKSEVFVTMLREHCRKVHIREVLFLFASLLMVNMSGHAPHDEVPDEVNSLLCEWMEETEVTPALEKSKAI